MTLIKGNLKTREDDLRVGEIGRADSFCEFDPDVSVMGTCNEGKNFNP